MSIPSTKQEQQADFAQRQSYHTVPFSHAHIVNDASLPLGPPAFVLLTPSCRPRLPPSSPAMLSLSVANVLLTPIRRFP